MSRAESRCTAWRSTSLLGRPDHLVSAGLSPVAIDRGGRSAWKRPVLSRHRSSSRRCPSQKAAVRLSVESVGEQLAAIPLRRAEVPAFVAQHTSVALLSAVALCRIAPRFFRAVSRMIRSMDETNRAAQGASSSPRAAVSWCCTIETSPGSPRRGGQQPVARHAVAARRRQCRAQCGALAGRARSLCRSSRHRSRRHF